MILMETGYTSGQMVGDTTDPGKETKWKGEEYSHGKMAGDMKENIKMIGKKVTENSSGQMEEYIKVSGEMVSRMAQVPLSMIKEFQEMELGKKESGFLGKMSNFLNLLSNIN